MKKALLLIPTVFFAGCSLFPVPQELKPDSTTENLSGDAQVQQTETDSLADQNKEIASSRYFEYSQEAYNKAADQQRVLFFHAQWCPDCREADQEILESLDQIPSNAAIFKTDYDTENELKKKYGVTYQHTFALVDENGELVDIWNGGGIDEIIEMVEKHS